ncbi:hypothetical protein K525DRAFT_256858 [Schizophyllum commune Loenen D]|nr:hypothetical protein K525DRAFT_256858 [Schizophyllum commune Loenen D]
MSTPAVDYKRIVGNDSPATYIVDGTSVTLYRGIPLNGGTPDGRRFLSLGKLYGHFFIDVNDFEKRRDGTLLRHDYDLLKDGKVAFNIWNRTGGFVAAPTRNFVLDVESNETFESWSARQSRLWTEKVVPSVRTATPPSAGYSVTARFIQPADDIDLVFSTAEGEALTNRNLLQKHLDSLPSSVKRSRPYVVKSWADAKKDKSLILLSSSPFGFFHTWIPVGQYERVCQAVNTVPLQRPWPGSVADATKIEEDCKLVGKKGDTDESVDATITLNKIKAARGMRNAADDQQKVAGASATAVADKLWRGSQGNAEWLHRVAFRFGGLGASSNCHSAQQKRNLIFGTHECNTHMIRAENAITELVQGLEESGTLVTENILMGDVRRRRDDGEFDSVAIPTWLKTQREAHLGSLWWLCFRLKYEFTLTSARLNTALNMSVDFDPFSRYVPFRIEASLDSAILKDLVSNAGPSPAKKPRVSHAITPSSSSNASVPSASSTPSPIDDISARVSAELDRSRFGRVPGGLPWQRERNTPRGPIPPPQPAHGAVEELLRQQRSSGAQAHSLAVDLYSMAYLKPPSPPVSTQQPSFWAPGTASGISRIALGVGREREDEVVMDGVVIRSPRVYVHSEEKASRPGVQFMSARSGSSFFYGPDAQHRSLANEFTVQGEIDLFGVPGLTAEFSKWNGPAPKGSELAQDGSKAVYDRAIVRDSFKLSRIIPGIEGTFFDRLTFQYAVVTHQDAEFDSTKAVGWHLDVDLPIERSCGALHDVLRTVLGVKEPVVHLHAGLGRTQSWGKKLCVHSFALDGTFPGTKVAICGGLTLTSVGVELLGIRCMKMTPEPRSVLEYGFGIFGTLNIAMPGSVVPLEFDYNIREVGKVLQLSADLHGNIWDSPLGITGLRLSEVTFTSNIRIDAPLKSFAFEVSAVFGYGVTSAILSGSYSATEGVTLSTIIDDFSLDTLGDMYAALTGTVLKLPDIGVKVASASLTVSSKSGLSVVVEGLEVAGYTVALASLDIGPKGVTITGLLRTTCITLGEVDIHSAYARIHLSVNGHSSVALGGDITFAGLPIRALVYLQKGKKGEGLQWTVYGDLGRISVGDILPDVKGSEVGSLALTNVAFVVASHGDANIANDLFYVPYEVKKGVQICATMAPVSTLDTLLRRPDNPTHGLILRAAWTHGTGFELDITMPADTILELGNGIRTDPFRMRIHARPRPELVLIAGVKVPVALPAGESLNFALSLGLRPEGANAAAEMQGWWVNPLGLGKDVAVGPEVVLSIGILFAQFLTTGTPSEFAVGGGLKIGSKAASVLMQIAEDPSRELLKGHADELGVLDLITFANAVTGLSIPKPPEFAYFKFVDLYICPFGTTVGTRVYPQGFSFEASVYIFGKRASAMCAILDNTVTVKGELDSFALGPLAVRGMRNASPSVDITIGASEQRIFIDGAITFFDAGAAVHVDVQVMPKPIFQFFTELHFTDLLVFKLEAQLKGALTFGSLDRADFEFMADFEQNILRYVRDEIDKQFALYQSSAAAGIKQAQDELNSTKRQLDRNIDGAKRAVDRARAEWNAKYHEVVDQAQATINDYLRTLRDLENALKYAERDYKKALSDAQMAVQQANNDRAAAMRDVNRALEYAKRDAAAAINSAVRDLQRAKDDMNRHFGYATRDIDRAKAKVADIDYDIRKTQNAIDWCNSLPWYDPRRAAIVGHGIALGALYTAREVAWAALDVAKAVLHSARFVAAEGAIGGAQEALKGARTAATESIKAAETAVTAADHVSREAVNAANETLGAVKWGGQYIAFKHARDALSTFHQTNDAVLKAAREAIDTVEECLEYAAFTTAQKALDVAKEALKSLDALRKALELAKASAELALRVGQWLADHLLSLVDIRKIHLEGTLRGMLGVGGKISKPFSVYVEYTLAGRDGTFYGELDLRDVAAFIACLFAKLLKEIDAIIP